ncbi:MAG: hypothetical protein KGJ13_06720, partial [Patescibacteria group bacterium]|nr:hypothetical protein [Patescibacteria group bacterium]
IAWLDNAAIIASVICITVHISSPFGSSPRVTAHECFVPSIACLCLYQYQTPTSKTKPITYFIMVSPPKLAQAPSIPV